MPALNCHRDYDGDDGSWEMRLQLGNVVLVSVDHADTRMSLKEWARSSCGSCWLAR